jgi:YiiM-like, 3-alpha helix domain
VRSNSTATARPIYASTAVGTKPCTPVALACDCEVEAVEPELEKLSHELVAAHLDPELETGKPWLGHDRDDVEGMRRAADLDVLPQSWRSYFRRTVYGRA